MFGHCDSTRSWARHILALRDLQSRTFGITEFVPLPFVHMEAPIYLKGKIPPPPPPSPPQFLSLIIQACDFNLQYTHAP